MKKKYKISFHKNENELDIFEYFNRLPIHKKIEVIKEKCSHVNKLKIDNILKKIKDESKLDNNKKKKETNFYMGIL